MLDLAQVDGLTRWLLRMHLDHGDQLTVMEHRLDEQVDQLMGPFAEPATRLLTIPGMGKRGAIVVAEIGVDMSRFPTAAHLASWAGLFPGNHESAGKRRSGKARKGSPTVRADGYRVARYRRFQRRFGTKGETKAIIALAHTVLVIIWHVHADETTYQDLGGDYFARRNDTEARQRYPVRQLVALGQRVTREPAA